MANWFTKHLEEINEGYFEHMFNASYYSLNLLLACVCVTVHAILPCFFKKTASNIVVKLNGHMRRRLESEASPPAASSSELFEP